MASPRINVEEHFTLRGRLLPARFLDTSCWMRRDTPLLPMRNGHGKFKVMLFSTAADHAKYDIEFMTRRAHI